MKIFDKFVTLYRKGDKVDLYLFLESEIVRWVLKREFNDPYLIGDIDELYERLSNEIRRT